MKLHQLPALLQRQQLKLLKPTNAVAVVVDKVAVAVAVSAHSARLLPSQ